MTFINILVILGLLFIHWVTDFILQTDEQALNKSTSNRALASHVGTYTLYYTMCLATLQFLVGAGFQPFALLGFALITFVAHFITDYYTSRANARLWQAGKRHDFFVMVGFDQFLHYTQLLLTYFFLFI